MPKPTCRHVHANGALCKSPPLHKRDYCHFHLDQIGRQLRAARARARYQPASLRLPLLEDPFAVQVALMQVADAIVYNEIDVPRGRLLMSVLRTASRNLKELRDWEHEPVFAAGAGSKGITEWPTFEQENQLPPGFDVSADPEAAFPLHPLNPTDGLSGAPEMYGNNRTTGAPYIPGVGMYGNDGNDGLDAALRERIRQTLGEAKVAIPSVSADQLELLDICEREGYAAARKFHEQTQRNERRRQRRLQRAQYEEMARNQTIQLAAKRLLEKQQDEAKAAAAAAANAPAVGSDARGVESGSPGKKAVSGAAVEPGSDVARSSGTA